MHRIDSNGTAVALPTPGAVGATVGYFTEGNPGTGTPATVVSADWLNATQEELIKIVVVNGLTLDKTAQDQVWKAIKLMANKGDIKSVSSADYVVLDQDFYRTVSVSTGASNRTMTLPTAADNTGREITFIKTDSGAGTVIVDGEGSETINGATTYTLHLQYDSVRIRCNGTGWEIICIQDETIGSFSCPFTSGAGASGSGTTQTVHYHRKGNMVTLMFPDASAMTAGTSSSAFQSPASTIPSTILPVVTEVVQVVPTYNNSIIATAPGKLSMRATGEIYVFKDIAASGNYSATANSGFQATSAAYRIY